MPGSPLLPAVTSVVDPDVVALVPSVALAVPVSLVVVGELVGEPVVALVGSAVVPLLVPVSVAVAVATSPPPLQPEIRRPGMSMKPSLRIPAM